MSMGIAIIVAFLLSLVFFIFRFKYFPKPIIDISIVKKITTFSLGTYFAGLIGNLPATILPLLLINSIGAKFSAYFYMGMMIANIIYIIPSAVSQSLFAEGSYSEKELKVNLIKAIKIISIIVIPVIIITSLFGNYILLAFGEKYSNEGFMLLRYLSISGIFVSVNTIGSVILSIKHKIKLLISLNLINTTIILLVSIFFIKMDLFGIVGIGIAWIIGQATTTIIYLLLIKRLLK